MQTQVIDETDRALKAKHRAIWAMGDYHAVATEVVAELGAVLVDAVGVRPGDWVLDIAAGSGNAAIPAALAGGRVVASDLTPELFEPGRELAAWSGAEIEWDQADAEHLPYADGEFDTALSCLGVMFAPHHQATADELVRVVRPGGRVGILNWTPQGFIGQLFATMKPYAPPPPPDAQPGPLWGDEEHVRKLFGSRVVDLDVRRQELTVHNFPDPRAFVDYFKKNYGPVIATFKANAGDAYRVAALDHALLELARRFQHDGVMKWEYLLVTGKRA